MPYDVVGISAIVPNVGKVKRMCEIVRRHQPQATLVVGGHIANRPGLRDVVDADHVVAGEGVAWFRAFLGEDVDAPIRHPLIVSAFGERTMGVPFGRGPGETAATVIPSVGCPLGCNFCSTSAMFGGKGRFVSFYEGGDELYEVMRGLAQSLGVRSFFVMDENFLLHKKRALRLLERMREDGKAWALYVFSSANALRQYTDDQLVGLGISWVWLGLEGEASAYAKLNGTDTRALVARLQALGIRVLGSSIVGLPEHGADNIDRAIDHAVAHDTEFHQFMLYTPVPGTPLYAEHRANGTLLSQRGVPRRRHPRTAPLQLPAPAHPERRGDRVPAAGLPPRLRGERAERHAHRAHAAARLARPQGPPRPARARADRVRDEGPRRRQYAGALWASERWFARANPGARRAAARDPPWDRAGLRLEGPPRRAARRPGRSSPRSGSRSSACATAGPTSPPRSTRRTPQPPRGPKSRREALSPAAA